MAICHYYPLVGPVPDSMLVVRHEEGVLAMLHCQGILDRGEAICILINVHVMVTSHYMYGLAVQSVTPVGGQFMSPEAEVAMEVQNIIPLHILIQLRNEVFVHLRGVLEVPVSTCPLADAWASYVGMV